RAMQGECLKPARAAEQRARLADAGLELAFHPGRNVDLGDFGDHGSSTACWLLCSARPRAGAMASAELAAILRDARSATALLRMRTEVVAAAFWSAKYRDLVLRSPRVARASRRTMHSPRLSLPPTRR